MSKSNSSHQHDGDYRVHTHELGDASMLLIPAVSCWEAWRWEMARAALRRGPTSFKTLGENQVMHPQRKQER
jgi:hypothetical protein